MFFLQIKHINLICKVNTLFFVQIILNWILITFKEVICNMAKNPDRRAGIDSPDFYNLPAFQRGDILSSMRGSARFESTESRVARLNATETITAKVDRMRSGTRAINSRDFDNAPAWQRAEVLAYLRF